MLALAGMTLLDTLNVNAGAFTFPASAGPNIAAVSLGTLQIASGASATVAEPSIHASRTVLVLGSLSIAAPMTPGSAGLTCMAMT